LALQTEPTKLHRRSTRQRLAAKAVLIALSGLLSVAIIEGASRIVLNSADYLSVTTIPDAILGMRIKPSSAGFDDWGFRNREVPTTVDVLALGDSHTYGNTAKMNEAWPQVLARVTGRRVYNMGLGGYGPNQYYELLTTRGISLKPKQVLVGLYLGDDFENAFSITYGLDHWAFLRTRDRGPVNADIWGDSQAPGSIKQVRNWLSSHSLLYRLLVHGPALARLKANLQFGQVTGSSDPFVAVIEAPADNIREAFRPIRIAAGLDQRRSEVREGIRITYHLLGEMNGTCLGNGCSLTVVIIPSKETVFADYLQRDSQLHLKDVVESLIRNERAARTELETFLQHEGIRYVDVLPALRNAVRNELYYRGPADMHPSANGYRVIGAAVAEFLQAPPQAANVR
jgi:SGNH hydrolase-like domain, acetyltransferase AlgX